MNPLAQQTAAPVQTANIKYGPSTQPIPCAGKTVAQLRAELANTMSIPPDVKAFKGKTELDENYVVQPNDTIELVRRLGEKG